MHITTRSTRECKAPMGKRIHSKVKRGTAAATARAVLRLVKVMAKLRAPGGCPWDADQTPASLKSYIVEEAYEVLERSGGAAELAHLTGEAGFSRGVVSGLESKGLVTLVDEEVMRPGMSVRADIYTETSDETLAIPVQAVQYDEDIDLDADTEGATEQAFVFVVEEGKARRREVRTGISSDSDQEIIEGLEAGETVVTGPFRELRNLADGDEVKKKTRSEEEDED